MSDTSDTRTDDEADVDEGTRRRLDPELRVLGAIIRLLDEVELPARNRIVAYLAARFEGE